MSLMDMTLGDRVCWAEQGWPGCVQVLGDPDKQSQVVMLAPMSL